MSKFGSSLRSGGVAGVLTGLICVGALAGPARAAGAATPPDFSPNASVGWVSIRGGFKPPPSGAGPIADDPAHPTITNDDYRITGKQPTFPVADLSNPRAENPLVAENDSTTSAAIADPMLEASCAENNFSYFANDSIPIPQANKPDF